MARWRGKDTDKLEKYGKMRRRGRKSSAAADLQEEYEKSEDTWQLGGDSEAFAARVVEVHKRYAFISSEPQRGKIQTNDVWLATIARKFLQAERAQRNFVVVGDRVLCTPAAKSENVSSDLPQCVIQNMTPRRSKIARLDPHTPVREHVLASNMDQLVIVASYLHPSVKWGLIDRYLVLAESEGVNSIIVLNKADLLETEADAEMKDRCREMVAIYRAIGYTVFEVQANAEDARNDPSIQQLQQLLQDKVSLFSGHSGVGKSSIVNLFDPELIQSVEPDDDIFYKGRHTTTFASFIKLGTGGYIIDTPGIRSFTFEEKGAIELSHCFVEMRPLLGRCKFRECRHIEEPECLVREAVERGDISRWRYKSYLGILSGATGREGRIRDLPIEDDT